MKRIVSVVILLLAARCATAQTYGRMDFTLQNAQGQAISGATVNVYLQPTAVTTANVSTVQVQAVTPLSGSTLYYALVTFTANVPAFVSGQTYAFSGLTAYTDLNGQTLSALSSSTLNTASPIYPGPAQALFLFGSATYGSTSDTGSAAVVNSSTCGSPANISQAGQAPLYSSATGGALPQPITTNGFGSAFAYASQGCYTVVYNSPYTGTRTFADQNAIPAGNATSNARAQGVAQAVQYNNNGALAGSAATADSTGHLTLSGINGNIYVDGNTYATIQAAVNAAGAGGTIVVPAGHTETITAGITLASNNQTLKCEPGATITKGAAVDALTITGTGDSVTGCTVDGNAQTSGTIATVAISGGVATVTLTAILPANYIVGSLVVPSGTGISGFDNSVLTIATVGSSSFTATTAATGSASAGTTLGGWAGNGVTLSGATNALVSGATIKNVNGNGIYLTGVNGAIVSNNNISNITTGTSIYGESQTSNVVVSGNRINRAGATTLNHAIAFHSNTLGAPVSNISISHNNIVNGPAYAIEVGSFGTISAQAQNIAITGNSISQAAVYTGAPFGCISTSGVDGVSTTANVCLNLSGVISNPGIETVDSVRATVTGNLIWGERANFNNTSSSVFSSNTVFPLYPGPSSLQDFGFKIGGSTAGINNRYDKVQNNVFNRTPWDGAATWSANHTYSPGLAIQDANGKLQLNTTEVSNAGCVSGSGTPTWNTVQGGYTIDGQCQWQLVTAPPASPEAFYGVILQCNGSANADCSYNDISGNTIIDNGTSTGQGISISNANSGTTMTDTTVAGNKFVGWTACYAIGPTAGTVYVYNNDENGCVVTGLPSNVQYSSLSGMIAASSGSLNPVLNYVPDSGLTYGSTWWTCRNSMGFSGSTLTATGTGAPFSPSPSCSSGQITGLVPGKPYSFSANINATNATLGGPPTAEICADALCAVIYKHADQTLGASGTVSNTWTPAGGQTSAYFIMNAQDSTVTNSTTVVFSQPQFNAGPVIFPYSQTTTLPPSLSAVGTNSAGAVAPNTCTANTIVAGPSSGGAAYPACRSLVAADLPGAVSPVLCRLLAPVTNTGSTAQTQVYTCTIAAGAVAATGTLDLIAAGSSCTASTVPLAGCTVANTGTCSVTAFLAANNTSKTYAITINPLTVTAAKGWSMRSTIQAQNSTSAQIANPFAVDASAAAGNQQIAGTINFANPVFLNFFITNSVSGDICSLDQLRLTYTP